MRHNGPVNRQPLFAPAALLAAAVAWTLTLGFGDPSVGTTAAAVAAVDLLLVTVVVIIGLVVVRGRWARRYAFAPLALMAGMALTMSVSNNWIIALVLSGLAVVAVTGPSLDEILPPSAVNGPPARAVALPLVLLVFPAVVAFAAGSELPWFAWILILGAPLTAWAYGKALVAGLWSARVLIPLAAVAVFVTLDWWSMILLGAVVGVEMWLAWSDDAAQAVSGPDRLPASGLLAIAPELAPPEVLSAAGLDDRGRKRAVEVADPERERD